MKITGFIGLLLFSCGAYAQYAPQAGMPGSTGIHKDTTGFTGWAGACAVQRGYKNISNPLLGVTDVGEPYMAEGKAGNIGLVCLGDGGMATLTFYPPIINLPGPDLAVFENGFLYAQDSALAYLELGFVEVSSDGINFVRFPASSLTDTATQVGAFGTLDAKKIHNLAGKYVFPYGTPFDLEELKNQPFLDVSHITHVRIIDVVGSLLNNYASLDKDGRIINDPWPTEFGSGGFDLDAVGALHQQAPNGLSDAVAVPLTMYPNPAVAGAAVKISGPFAPHAPLLLRVLSANGIMVSETNFDSADRAILSDQLGKGIYLIEAIQSGFTVHAKLMVK